MQALLLHYPGLQVPRLPQESCIRDYSFTWTGEVLQLGCIVRRIPQENEPLVIFEADASDSDRTVVDSNPNAWRQDTTFTKDIR
jgi:hypothetical protein